MERCEDRRMLSGDAFIGTIELFGDSLTDADGGGFFYRLDQADVVGLPLGDIVSSLRATGVSHNVAQWHVSAGELVVQFNVPAFDFSLDLDYIVLSNAAGNAGPAIAASPAIASDFLDADSSGMIPMRIDLSRHVVVENFLPESVMTRISLVPPAMVSFDHPPEDVISLASLFDTNQRTHDTELLAIRSALLASHHNQPLGSEAADVSQPMDRVVLQEAESESTWDRVWTFDLASFSSSRPLAIPNDVTEVSSESRDVTPPLYRPVSLLPAGDSLGRVLIEQDAVVPVEDLAISVRSQDQAFAEFDPTGFDSTGFDSTGFDSMDIPSNAWSLAADRRGGWAISAVALLVAQRAWSISSTPTKGEEKEEPRRNNGTTK